MGLHGTVERLGHASALDRVGEPLRRGVWRVLPRGRVTDRAADTLVALGTAASLPTVAAGLADWSAIEDPETRRMGVVHAIANGAALALFTASLLARPGDRAAGRRLATLGSGVLALGGYVGAHLSYAHGVGS